MSALGRHIFAVNQAIWQNGFDGLVVLGCCVGVDGAMSDSV